MGFILGFQIWDNLLEFGEGYQLESKGYLGELRSPTATLGCLKASNPKPQTAKSKRLRADARCIYTIKFPQLLSVLFWSVCAYLSTKVHRSQVKTNQQFLTPACRVMVLNFSGGQPFGGFNSPPQNFGQLGPSIFAGDKSRSLGCGKLWGFPWLSVFSATKIMGVLSSASRAMLCMFHIGIRSVNQTWHWKIYHLYG